MCIYYLLNNHLATKAHLLSSQLQWYFLHLQKYFDCKLTVIVIILIFLLQI